MSIDASRTAVVFIEFQNEFCAEGFPSNGALTSCLQSNNMLENAGALLSEARKMGVAVVHVPIGYSADFREIGPEPYGILAGLKAGGSFVEGTPGQLFYPPMQPLAEEPVIKGKHGLCAFSSTDLDFVLRHRGITTIAIAGFLTNLCVESTMRTAYERGYKVVTVTDACAALSVEAHLSSIKHTFGAFSTPMLHSELLAQLSPASA